MFCRKAPRALTKRKSSLFWESWSSNSTCQKNENMKPEINELVSMSRFYGTSKEYVIAGGGNTSFKDERTIWIKASGHSLAELDENGIVALSREKLHVISGKIYSDDPVIREEQVKNDLFNSIIDQEKPIRPSVETSLHELIQYKFVVHLHPTLINGVLCSRNAKTLVVKLLGEKVLFVPYTDPGYTLFKKLESEINSYRSKYASDPQIILLENHGSFVSADSTDEIRKIYGDIISAINAQVQSLAGIDQLPDNPELFNVLPALRMFFAGEKIKIIKHRHNTLIARYYQSQQEFHKISLPLTPDMIVYCKTRYMFIEQHGSAEKILESVRLQLPRFQDEYGFLPVIIMIKNTGLLAVENSAASAEKALDGFEDLIKISYYSSLCGGIKPLTPDQASFIDKWEVENYRRKIIQSTRQGNKLNNKIAIVTVGAQGFGAGIAEALYRMQVNVVIGDLNTEAGNKFVSGLQDPGSPNKAVFVRTDVADPESVQNLVKTAVKEVGGLDIMVSNAGVLKAGGLDEMEPDQFNRKTNINY